jgi:14-3-3 protein epsilon
MVEAMKKVAMLNKDLKPEERNLFSVGYKNIIGTRRASWRVISSLELKEEGKGEDASSVKLEAIKDFKRQIEKELKDICNDIFEVLENYIIPSATESESKMFFHKM